MADINVSRLKTSILTQDPSITQLVVGKDYLFTGNDTVTLPTVSGLIDGTTLRCIKRDNVVPTIQVEGGSSEVININQTNKQDTSILFDIESEIIILWNSTDNRWEI